MDRHKLPVASSQSRYRFPSGHVSRVFVGLGVGRIDESLLVAGKIRLPSYSVHPEVMKWITLSHFVLVVIIIIAQVKVYIRACEYFRFGAHRPTSSSDRRQEQAVDTVGVSSNSSSHNRLKSDEYFAHLPDKTISRLELEASVTLCCGVATLCLFTLPLTCLFLAIFICQAIGQSWVGKIVAFVPYARELLLLHPVIVTLLYVLRSQEFSCAFRRMMPRCFANRRRRQGEEERDIPLRQFWIIKWRAQCQLSIGHADIPTPRQTNPFKMFHNYPNTLRSSYFVEQDVRHLNNTNLY